MFLKKSFPRVLTELSNKSPLNSKVLTEMISPILLKCLYNVPTNAFIFTSIQSWFTTIQLLPSGRDVPHPIRVGVLIACRLAGGSPPTSHLSVFFQCHSWVISGWVSQEADYETGLSSACVLSHFNPFWLCEPLDCNPPGPSVLGILQARMLEWVAVPSSGRYSWPRDWTWVSCISCIAGGFFTHWANWEAPGLAVCVCVSHSVMLDSLWSHRL